MAAENSEYALAIGRAIKAVDSSIIYVALAGSEMEKAGHRAGAAGGGGRILRPAI